MPPIRSTLSVICPWTVVLLFASFVAVAVLRISPPERISEKQRANSQILGVFLVVITVLLVSCTSNISSSSPQTITPTPATRIVLPVCNCEEFISSDESIVVRLRWGAKRRDLAEQGADFVVYTATVDGTTIEGLDECRKPAVFESSSADNEDAWWVYWDAPIGTLPAGDHAVEAVVDISATISDGWSTFQKGYSATLQVTLHVAGASTADLVYLAELHPQSATVGRGVFSVGKYEFASSGPTDGISKGDPIVLHDVEYPFGLYAHSPSRLAYNLYGDFFQLEATIGLADWIECGDGAQFIILLDGDEIFRSPTMRASSTPIAVKVSIAGGRNLVLITDPGATQNCDWAIWGDPTLR